MTTRPFSEVISTYRSRFNGLAEEYYTIEFRWKHLHSVLMDDRLLPDLSKTVYSMIPKFLSELNSHIEECEKIAKSTVSSKSNVKRDREMKRVSEGLLLIARFLSYIKSAFYQRTISLEIPYVLAGLPISPETRWGDELYLISADNLIKNYSDVLDLHGFSWSGFTSYAPMHPYYGKFPGATYSSFVYMFHITLSSEMKYFLCGFLILSHELGHASIENLETRTEKGRIPEIMYRFLWELHQVRRRVYSYFCDKLGDKRTREKCKDCRFKEDLCNIAFSRKEFEEFIENVWDNRFIELFYEIAADIIGMTISGPYYLSALFDYAFRNIVSWEEKTPELHEDFEKLLIRIAACYSFANARGSEWSGKTREILKNIISETYSSVVQLKKAYKTKFLKCIPCLKRIGSIIGNIYAENFDLIFSDTFREDSTGSNASEFTFDSTILDKIRQGHTVCDVEPRQIIHACLEVMREGYEDLPAALFSLANNFKCRKSNTNDS